MLIAQWKHFVGISKGLTWNPWCVAEKANYIPLAARLGREEYLLCFDGSCTWPEFSVEGETGEPPSKSSIYNLTSFSPSRSPTFLLLLLLPYSETCSSTIFHHSAFKHWVGTSREWKFSTNRNVCPLFAEMCEEKPFLKSTVFQTLSFSVNLNS